MARTVIPLVVQEERPTTVHRRWPWVAVMLVVLALVVWTALSNSRRTALSHMSLSDRHALYVRVMENAKVVCASGEPGLKGDCQSQLDFLADFPECDAACQTLIATYRPPPTK